MGGGGGGFSLSRRRNDKFNQVEELRALLACPHQGQPHLRPAGSIASRTHLCPWLQPFAFPQPYASGAEAPVLTVTWHQILQEPLQPHAIPSTSWSLPAPRAQPELCVATAGFVLAHLRSPAVLLSLLSPEGSGCHQSSPVSNLFLGRA